MLLGKKLDIINFLNYSENVPVIDVRSPAEYLSGHIPGATNIPLFNDREREAVGIKYKLEGRVSAIIEGLKLTGPAMHTKLEDALNAAKGGSLLVHCWRGGMRSETMSWLFTLGDIENNILEGGYKAYRNYILQNLSERRKVIILGGLTGSSKTHILGNLKNNNNQVVDLEGLANHKGSAFGSLGQMPQPSTEHFANLLFEKLIKMNNNMPVWMEDESRNIGTVFLPEKFYSNMQGAPTIVLIMDIKTRLPRLIKEYSSYPPEALKGSIMKISKRLGGDNTRDALAAVDAGDFEKAIEIALNYYDKTYMFGIKRKQTNKVFYIQTDTDDIEINSSKVLDLADKITW
jgi:tRNA 2-selenouridine synthase